MGKIPYAVILLPLLCVGEGFVSRAKPLEFLRELIGRILSHKLEVRALDLALVSVPVYLEDIVVIFHYGHALSW